MRLKGRSSRKKILFSSINMAYKGAFLLGEIIFHAILGLAFGQFVAAFINTWFDFSTELGDSISHLLMAFFFVLGGSLVSSEQFKTANVLSITFFVLFVAGMFSVEVDVHWLFQCVLVLSVLLFSKNLFK